MKTAEYVKPGSGTLARLGGGFPPKRIGLISLKACKLHNLVERFCEDLSRGAVDVDKYYREAEDVVCKTPPSQLVDVLNEVFEQHIGALPVVEPNALHLSLVFA